MRLRVMAGAGAIALAGLLAAAPAARAVPAYVTQGINLRAGPGVDYPWLASLPPGTPAELFGCLPDYTWCDIAVQGLRGWAAGVGLQVAYGGQPEPVIGYGTQLGVPAFGFEAGSYWGSHYRDRPFYGQLDRWRERPEGRWPDRGRPEGFRGGPPEDRRGQFDGRMQRPEHGPIAGYPAAAGPGRGAAGGPPPQARPQPGPPPRDPDPGQRPGGYDHNGPNERPR